MSVEIAGEYLSVSADKIYDMARDGAFALRKIGARTEIKKDDVDGWIESRFPSPADQVAGESGRA